MAKRSVQCGVIESEEYSFLASDPHLSSLKDASSLCVCEVESYGVLSTSSVRNERDSSMPGVWMSKKGGGDISTGG